MNLRNAKVIGFFSSPSASLAETNPSAYSLALAGLPPGAGSCAHCGTGITHHVVVELEDRRRVFIGTTCAIRVGDDSVRVCVRERLTDEQREKRDREREEKNAIEDARRELERLAIARRLARRYEALREPIDALEALEKPFYNDLASQLRSYELSPRQATYAVKAILGRETKKNREAWYALFDRLTEKETD